MEINVKAEPKEIAALVVELQGRQDVDVKLTLDGKKIASVLQEKLKKESTRDHLCT